MVRMQPPILPYMIMRDQEFPTLELSYYLIEIEGACNQVKPDRAAIAHIYRLA